MQNVKIRNASYRFLYAIKAEHNKCKLHSMDDRKYDREDDIASCEFDVVTHQKSKHELRTYIQVE